MSPLELSAKAQEVIRKVQKLLAIANDERGNEHQAAVAASKAQELLEAYNLDMSTIGAAGAQRTKDRMKGGLYQWQRDLWQAVAELNFCRYWFIRGLRKGQSYQHQVLGRKENVVGTQILAEYLEQTINRLAQEKAKDTCRDCGRSADDHENPYWEHEFVAVSPFKSTMIAYREGMAERLSSRLYDLRRAKLREERLRQQEAKERASEGMSSTNPHAVVLSTVIEDEDALNTDFINGLEPGTTARRRAEAEARYQRELEEREQWKRDNPEAWARQQEANRKADEEWERKNRNRKYRERAQTPRERRRDLAEFDEGFDKGGEIPLNQQLDKSTMKPLG